MKMIALLTAMTAFAVGCAGEEETPSASPNVATPPQNSSVIAQVPAPAMAYVRSVNQNNLDSLVLAFAETGTVVDVTRRIEGRSAIRTWARNEVMGASLQVLSVDQQTPNRVRLLVHWAPRGSAGWRAYYTFTYENGLVTLADLQYA